MKKAAMKAWIGDGYMGLESDSERDGENGMMTILLPASVGLYRTFEACCI